MDTLHHKYIGTRFGPIAEAIGMPHLMDQQQDPNQGGDPFAGTTGTGVKRPSSRMGPTGAGKSIHSERERASRIWKHCSYRHSDFY